MEYENPILNLILMLLWYCKKNHALEDVYLGDNEAIFNTSVEKLDLNGPWSVYDRVVSMTIGLI